jgi:outer membrane protein assembly factor BamB
MTAEIVGPAGVAALSPMVQEGVSLWRAMIDVSNAPRGEYSVHLGGSFQDGRLIRSQSQFERRDVVPIVRAIGEDWPMFRKSAAGSSYTAVRVKPPLELAWTTPVPGMVALNSPVVANGKVFLGCRTETGDLRQSGIVCCDAITGAIEWYAPIPGGVALSPAVADNVVLVTAITDSVFGLNAATGETLWRKRTPGNKYKMTAPIFEGTTAWMGSEPAPIEIDTASGQVRWTSEVLGSAWYPAIYSAPAVNEDYVYFSFYGTPGRARDGFSVVDRQTGTIIYHENGTFRSPICAGDTVFVVTTHGPVAHALTARDRLGNVLWTSATKLGFGTGAPALGHGVIVVPGANGKIEALRASDGTHLWSHAVGFSLYDMWPNRRYQRDTIGSVAITDSVVYAGSADGNLYGLDLGSGTELWRWYFGTPIASTPAASGNMLFVGASDGHLYAFVETAVGVPRPTADLARSVPARSNHFALYAPTPNPTVSAVEFEWVMPARARVRIDICDVAGRRIRKLLEEEREAGEHLVSWDGRDDRGVDSASGIYFVRLVAGESVALRKLVYLGR